jgi:hydrogenase maturation factor HypF (carbamoyltransferase family)
MHKKKPGITSPELAERLGVSRQRVHSLALKMGIALAVTPRPTPPVGTCSICAKKLSYPGTLTHARCHYVFAVCAGCGVRFKLTRTNRERSTRVYHDRACFNEHAPGRPKVKRAAK